MPITKENVCVSEADYWHEEHYVTEFRNEYVDGRIYAMAGESANHNHLSGNMCRRFGNHLESSLCKAFFSGFKVKVGANYFYPDVLVFCDDEHEYYTDKPTIIVEVLSPSTFKYDRLFKVDAYKKIPSLIECIIVEQDKCLVEVYYRRKDVWTHTVYGLGNDVHFKSIGLTLSVEEIYTNVEMKS